MRRRERARRAPAGPATSAKGSAAASLQTDAELLREVAGGDRAAFGQLYDRLAPTALSIGYRMLGSWREAEDLVHDVFLECWRGAARYDPARGSVRTWILVRTRSRAIDRMRKAQRDATLPLDDELLDGDIAHTIDLAAKTERLTLYRVLCQLSSEQRAVVELGYFGGYSSSEIALALEIPIGTVKSRMVRALDSLRQLLARNQRAHE